VIVDHQDTKTPREGISLEVDRVAKLVVDATFSVHSKLGPGLLESVYEVCLAHELSKRHLKFARQVPFPILYDDVRIEAGLRLDLVVEDSIIIELKAIEESHPVHQAQLLTYLKLSRKRLGFLINFNVPLIKDGIKRIAL
jgi:GxxExxY protein